MEIDSKLPMKYIGYKCFKLFFPSILLIKVIGILSCQYYGNQCKSYRDEIELKVGNDIKIPMVFIPPGRFKMGQNVGCLNYSCIALGSMELAHRLDDGPKRTVKLKNGFYISKYKVTADEFCLFLNDTDHDSVETLFDFTKITNIKKNDSIWIPKPNMQRHPINTVEWIGAKEYCRWLSKKTGMKIRLPSEKEWELAARGFEGRLHPWGKKEICNNWWDMEKPVDWHSCNKTPRGVVGMVSAAYGEWCQNIYSDRVLGGKKDSSYHVLRGRSNHAECTSRTKAGKVKGVGIFTFRIIAELTQ